MEVMVRDDRASKAPRASESHGATETQGATETRGAQTLRERLATSLRTRIGDQRYDTWFSGAAQIEVSQQADERPRAVLTAGSSFEQGLLRRQLHADVEAAAQECLGADATVIYRIAGTNCEATSTSSTGPSRSVGGSQKRPRREPPTSVESVGQGGGTSSQSITASQRLVPAASQLADSNTSATSGGSTAAPSRMAQAGPVAPAGWVVGESNAAATKASQRILAAEQSPSPLLLWGPSGVGKTHLLRAIADGVRRRNRRCRVLAITAEQFLREFVEAARGGGFPSFRQKHQGADLLILDDVHQLIGKARTVEELRQTIDSAIEAGSQVVLSADRGPTELRSLGPEIASRLSGGLSVEIGMPDANLRERLVVKSAERIGLELSANVARTLACRLLGGGREVSGAINRLALLHETFASPLDEDLARRVADDTNRLSTPPVRLADIQRAVCGVCNVDLKTLRSDKRTKSVTEPRMLAMWLARKMTGSAWSEIGEYFGRRSHSTVIAAHRRVEKLLSSPEPTRLVVGELGETIRRVEAELRTA